MEAIALQVPLRLLAELRTRLRDGVSKPSQQLMEPTSAPAGNSKPADAAAIVGQVVTGPSKRRSTGSLASSRPQAATMPSADASQPPDMVAPPDMVSVFCLGMQKLNLVHKNLESF